MEKLLALFFNGDFLEAAVQPFKGKFSVVASTDDNKYYFYFRVNPYTQQIDFGADYKKNFRDRQGLFLGDLIKNVEEGNRYNIENISQEYITLFDCIIKSIRELYAQKLKVFDNSFSLGDDDVVDAVAVFSDNISLTASEKIINYFRTKKINITAGQSLDTLAVKYFAAKNGLYCQNRKFAVLEALGANLNMSVVKADGKSFTRENFRQFKGYGIDPMVKVIAEKIVKSVNLTEHIIDSDNKGEINAEIIRHYDKAEAVIRHFEKNADKRTIKISTVFACNPGNKIPVTLSLDELNATAYNISRQYSAFFTNGFLTEYDVKISGLENVILVGNPLGNKSIMQEFSALAGAKIRHISSSEAENFLSEAFDAETPVSEIQDEESTAFMFGIEEDAKEEPEPAVYVEVPELRISSLTSGQNVYIDTFDPTPGKGAAFQEFEYTGGNVFRVLSSGRSLKQGDVATAVYDVWKPEMQLDFLVTRGAKNLGKFRTRVVKKIRVK
jgi:hypothetical protein